jgi:glyoxylase-like metal-dependent hydrolase (beta-lactamase superfamily II)
VLFEAGSRTLISADALWENGFGVVFPELEGEQAFDEVGATLDLIEALAPLTVVPGHGPVFSFSGEVMARARQRLDSFVLDPVRHAQHAGKVLMKFKLLEMAGICYVSILISAQMLTLSYSVLLQRKITSSQQISKED